MSVLGIVLLSGTLNLEKILDQQAAGGLWQAIAFGFAGLRLGGNEFKVSPNLPAHWKSLVFRFYYHGQQHTVRLTPGTNG
jgi:kojibiose phosphorylase